MDLFPNASVGGGSDVEGASQLLEVHCGIGEPVLTDIDSDKKIFRKCAWGWLVPYHT